jgi:hypothetical protein
MNLKKMFQNEVMEFYCHPDLEGVLAEPIPAYKKMPDWYRTLQPHIPETKERPVRDVWGARSLTAKKCMPMLDCMSLGYIIPLAGGVHIKTNHDCSEIKATGPKSINSVEFHTLDQLGGRNAPGFPAQPIKFLNYWVIKTKPGYSALFTAPFNHFNPHFTCISGLVDTDKYPKEVNFPAIWHTPNFDDYIPAGTPLVQVIPIRRSDASRKPRVRQMTKKEFSDIDKIRKKQDMRRSYYTDELREPRK